MSLVCSFLWLQVSLQSADCLSLTIEEVIHIRRVLAKAELESLIVHPELYQLVAKGKVIQPYCFYYSCQKPYNFNSYNLGGSQKLYTVVLVKSRITQVLVKSPITQVLVKSRITLVLVKSHITLVLILVLAL